MAVTFAEGFLRLVRAGGLLDSATRDSLAPQADFEAETAEREPDSEETGDPPALEPAGDRTAAPRPGISDIEAAVELVKVGLATRVVVTGLQSWPGLLWEAYKLADSSGVVILPSVVRPGGRVDIVIERDAGADV